MGDIRQNQGLDLWELDVLERLHEPALDVAIRPCDF
jgi:hypothetical protein